jgi:hypothetical protein
VRAAVAGGTVACMARTDAAVEIEIQKSTTFQKTRTPPQRSLHNLIRFKSFSIFERATSTDLFIQLLPSQLSPCALASRGRWQPCISQDGTNARAMQD